MNSPSPSKVLIKEPSKSVGFLKHVAKWWTGILLLISLLIMSGYFYVQYQQNIQTVEKIRSLKGYTELKYIFPDSLHHWIDKNISFINPVGITRVVRVGFSITGGDSPLTDADMKVFSGLGSLETLNLSSAHIKGSGLVHLKGLINLKELTIGSNYLKNESLEHLKDLPNLKVLTLPRNTSTRGVEEIKKIKSLTELHCHSGYLKSSDFLIISRMPNLVSIDFGGTSFGDKDFLFFTHLHHMKKINLISTQITDKTLIELEKCTQLKQLDVSFNKLSKASVEKLRKVYQARFQPCDFSCHY